MSEIRKHPLNVKGKYYVDYEECLDHECCVYEASSNFKMDRTNWGAYIFKQPQTDEEEAQCKEAMMCCPMQAIHDDGE
ncbi:MAG: ferredoxin [Acidobacteriota bacterium]